MAALKPPRAVPCHCKRWRVPALEAVGARSREKPIFRGVPVCGPCELSTANFATGTLARRMACGLGAMPAWRLLKGVASSAAPASRFIGSTRVDTDEDRAMPDASAMSPLPPQLARSIIHAAAKHPQAENVFLILVPRPSHSVARPNRRRPCAPIQGRFQGDVTGEARDQKKSASCDSSGASINSPDATKVV